MPLITGTNKSESLNGGAGDDTLLGGRGDDTLRGLDGADVINGGDDRDHVFGGEGSDTIVGGRGDIIAGEGGDDLMSFIGDEPEGISTAFNGGIGVDRLVLDFSAAFDSLTSSNSATGSGNMADVSFSAIEQFVMTGGTASDTLVASNGDDTLRGGGGNDRLDGKAGVNVFAGGSGRDIALLDLSATGAALSVTFTGADTTIGGSSFSSIEALGLFAGSGADLLDVVGAMGGSSLDGGGGNDTLRGANGWKDSLQGGDGQDRIEFGRGDTARGGAGDDVLVFNEGDINSLATTIAGDVGIDTLIVDFSAAFDRVESTHNAGIGVIEGLNYSGIDRLILTGGSASDKLVGTGANDTLTGNGGHDRLDGGAGFNKLVGGDNRDIGLIDLSLTIGQPVTVVFRAGKGLIAGTKFIEIESLGLKGTSGDDWVSVAKAAGKSELFGNGGEDTLTGQANWADTLDGGAGDDLINFHHGDSVRGGLDNDDLRLDQTPIFYSTTNVNGDAGLDTLRVDLSGWTNAISSDNGNTGGGFLGGSVGDWRVNYQGIEFLVVTGGSGADAIETGQGSDTIFGGAGNDTLDGKSDTDYLTGGHGADDLWGGLGVEGDFFIYKLISDSPGEGAQTDRIFDFTLADRIDLTAIDASAGTLEDDAFVFIGSAAFSGTAGELRYAHVTVDEEDLTVVSADVDGDGDADLVIEIVSHIVLTADQFLV